MCGLLVCVSSHPFISKELKLLDNLLDLLHHRGPDARGKYISEDKKVYLVGITFSEEEKNIIKFEWEELK